MKTCSTVREEIAPPRRRGFRTFYEIPHEDRVLDALRGTQRCPACSATDRTTGCVKCRPFALHFGVNRFVSRGVIEDLENMAGGVVMQANDSFAAWGEEMGTRGTGCSEHEDYVHVAIAFPASVDEGRAWVVAGEVLRMHADEVLGGAATDAADWAEDQR